MNAAIPFPGQIPRGQTQTLREPKLVTSALVQVALIVVPESIMMGLGQFRAGALIFIGMLTLFVLYHLAQREPLRAATLIVGVVPLLAFNRGSFFPFSAPLALMVASAAVAMLDTEHLERLRRHRILIAMSVAVAIYWWISILISGDYSANMKAVELLMSAVCVYLISYRRSLLGTALVAVGITVIGMGLGLLPHGDRLGMAEGTEEGLLGNPILLGIPAALTVMLTLLDGGRWLLLDKQPLVRNVLGLTAAGLLVLSTSKGAWAIALVGLVLAFIFDAASRKNLSIAVILVSVAVLVLLSTSRADIITKQFDKLLDPERDFASKTTGRSEQWFGFPAAFMAAPVLGHGPSKGREVSVEYTHKNIPFHSLYLHVGAETGLMGLALLFLFLGFTWVQTYHHRAETLEVAPMFGIVGFMVIGMSVSALDMLSGVYVGLALVAGHQTGVWRYREARVKAVAR
ncbi:MAG: O-antigen ligase family protein [Bryobacteraceae bacterium]